MAPHKKNRFLRQAGQRPPSSVETPPARPVAEPAIPELKKKEKERKGAGAAGYAGTGGATPGAGLNLGAGGARVGASLVSQPGFLGTGKLAAALSNLFGGPATFLGGVFAGKFGAALALGGVLSWGGVMAGAGLKILGGGFGGLGTVQSSSGAYLPGGMGGSGIVIDRPKNHSLGYVANANQGEIEWDKEHPNAPKKDEAPEDVVDAPEGGAAPELQMPDVSALMGEEGKEKGLDRGAFVRQLSKDTGGGISGGKLKSGLAGFDLKQVNFKQGNLKPAGARAGKLNASARAKSKLSARSMSTSRGQANKAMGQLKLSRFMSQKGTLTSNDQSQRQYAADAFDQAQSIGGELDGVGEGSGIVVPPGNGAPGVSSTPGDVAPPPNVGPGTNVTPYQGNVDRARNLDNQAGQNKMMSIMLIAIGIALIALGASMLNGPQAVAGAIIMAIGGAMVGMGMMMMMMAQNQAGAAKNEGQQIENRYGQGDQGDVIDDCADQAAGSGVNSNACAPSTTPQQIEKEIKKDTKTIKEAVDGELEATYDFGDGGGGEPGDPAPAQ